MLAVALGTAACAASPRPRCGGGEQAIVQDTLYLGAATPSGVVTPEAFAAFVTGVVTPRFPQGLTVWPASGQWRAKDGTLVREESRVLRLVHPGDEISERAVLDIAAAYSSRFEQEAVLRVRTGGCASLSPPPAAPARRRSE